MLLLLATALAYNDDGRAGFWERALRDRACAGLPCGFPGITLDECHERGCCCDATVPSTQTWCHGTPKKCASRADCNDRGDCADGMCACDAGFEGDGTSSCKACAPGKASGPDNTQVVVPGTEQTKVCASNESASCDALIDRLDCKSQSAETTPALTKTNHRSS